LVLDKILACSVDDIHYIINWKKAVERLEEVMKREYVLITGGLGYIGSHTVVELVKGENEHVIIIDNLNNAKIISMNRVKVITGRPNNFVFHQIDLRNKE
jgi:UDP-glucose 4-epimerase